MQPNWDYVKQITLWQYEDLIKKLEVIQAYPVLWQAYNYDMTQAAVFAQRLCPDRNFNTIFERLKSAGINDWGDLLSRISTRAGCVTFVAEHHLNFEELVDLLQYLLRWAFPFETASRELLAHDDPQEMAYYGVLKMHQLKNSYDILQQGHTLAGRQALMERTGLPFDVVMCLVHRADIARLPFVRRKTILPVCGAGYDSLAKIAAADPAQMETDLDLYFRRTRGRPWENYKSVILVQGLVAGALVLPVIVQV